MIEIPGYKVVRTLGKGGMATVYLAIQQSFEREVALKVMSPVLAEDPKFSARFLHEARIVSRLVHPNIVTVHDVGVHEKLHYLSMEYVPGMDLKQKRQSLTPPQSLQVIRDVARALDYASKKGYVHRDVKPENIMLHDDDGRAVLMDFGIACLADTRSGITQTGTAVGTPHYMSPEQAKGRQVDSRSDLYSLGVVLYLLLTGRVPFDADSAVAVGIKHVQEAVPRLPANLLVLQGIIDKALAKDPKDRFQSGAAFVAAIDAVTDEDIEAIQIATPHYEAHITAISKAQIAVVSGENKADKPAAAAHRGRGKPAAARAEVARASTGDKAGEAIFAVAEEDRRAAWPQAEPARRWPLAVAALLVMSSVAVLALREHLPPPVSGPLDTVAERLSEGGRTLGSNLSAVLGLRQENPSANLALSREAESVIDANDESSAAAAETKADATEGEARELEPSTSAMLVEQGRSLRDRLEKDLSVAPQLAGLYRQALAAYPGDKRAEWGLRDLREFHYRQLRESLKAGDRGRADVLFESLAASFPAQAEQQSLQADESYRELRQRFEALAAVDEMLAEAQAYLDKDALSSPEGANALDVYYKVLALHPDHPAAVEGLDRIALRYRGLADAALQRGNVSDALALLEQGLAVRANNEELLALRSEAAALQQRQQKIQALLETGETRMKQGKLYQPAQASAYQAFSDVLAMDTDNAQATQALEQIRTELVHSIERLINRNDFAAAREELHLLQQMSGSQDRSVSLELALERAIEADFLARQPRVGQLLVTSVASEDLGSRQPQALQVDRTIHVGFSYRNFKARTTVVQAMLYDASRSVQIAQVPVMVSGEGGVKYFQIDRPVDGFAKGAYTIDLVLDQQRLASQSFKVEPPRRMESPRAALNGGR